MLKTGKRYQCKKCGMSTICTKQGDGTGVPYHCGQMMEQIEKQSGDYKTFVPSPGGAAIYMGKRYACENCKAEMLCTKAGEGMITCHSQEMKALEDKPISTSD